VGAATLAAFAVVGGMAAAKASTLKADCPGNVCPPPLAGDLDDGRSLANAATGLLVAGSVLGAAGATLLILSVGTRHETPGRAAPTARLRVSPVDAHLGVTW
jgi:hypothetical protein